LRYCIGGRRVDCTRRFQRKDREKGDQRDAKD